MDNSFLKNKKILITGASSGIGKQTAIQLNSLGAEVILISRNNNKLREVCSILGITDCHGIAYDLNNLEGINLLVQEIVNKFGPLSGLVHCSGVYQLRPLRAINPVDYYEVFNVNLFSFIELVKAFSKKGNFNQQNSSIVAISSVAGVKTSSGLSIYGASKAALNSLVQSFALELVKKGIRVNSVVPSYIDTEMFNRIQMLVSESYSRELTNEIPLGIGKASNIADSIIFLLSKNASWVTGTNMVVDGGYLLK